MDIMQLSAQWWGLTLHEAVYMMMGGNWMDFSEE